jgi:hypothetical protein
MGSGWPRPRWVVPLALGLLCMVVYNANLRAIASGDTLPARYLPLIVWHDATVSLEKNERLVAHGHPVTRAEADNARLLEPHAYWIAESRRGESVSLYPVVAPIVVAPLYLPVAMYLEHDGWDQPKIDRLAEVMEKLSASLLAALASVVLLLVLRREGNRWAVPLAIAFAFGTTTWVISSQALWQHGLGELLVALGLLLSLGRRSPANTALLGFVCALMAANRPPDVMIAVAFALAAVWGRWRSVTWLVAGAIPPAVVVLGYNLGVLGDFLGGYGLADTTTAAVFLFDPLGPLGLLISPTRGLLVFVPFLAFVGIGLSRRLKDPRTRHLALALSAAAVGQLLFYSTADWRAGSTWGPRWLTDLLPVLVWMLAPAPLVLGRAMRRVFVGTVAVAISIQVIGAFWYTGVSDERIFADGASSMRSAWDPRNTPFLVEIRHRPAAAELLCGAGGFIDAVGPERPSAGDADPVLRSGALVQGWALACRRTPAQAMLLIDGHVVGATSDFLARPDVEAATGFGAPSGWLMIADTQGVKPGRRVLQLAVRITPRSDIRIVREETVEVAAPPRPEVVAERVAQRIGQHQSADGFWLTSYTESPTFTQPRPEMNTYLTALMVDLLAPISKSASLDGAVEAGRDHLRRQIEDTGLVRYHGLPDAPTIGTLGCAITPDADDSALAWRIVGDGARDPRAQSMLATIRHYRDARGLYRTWLASRDDYQCLDPGRIANPADIGIQMHVYLLLRELDPPAARDLCRAMRRAHTADDVWFYYARAPLVPFLRAAELQARGCSLPLSPEVLTARQVPGQEVWSELAIRLVEFATRTDDTVLDREGARRLLDRLSVDNFAAIRQTPPLLYHNDLTATVPRFYWSEDAGYALWLRLYEAVNAR